MPATADERRLMFLNGKERTVFERLRTWWLSDGPGVRAETALTADVTLTLLRWEAHYDVDTSAGDVNVTLPPFVGNAGRVVYLTKTDAANTLTVTGSINGGASVAATTQWTTLSLLATANGWRSI